MKKIISTISLLLLASSQIMAATFKVSQLTSDEKEVISQNLENDKINYDQSTDEIIISDELEQHLRSIGRLKTEASSQGTASKGGGGA